MLCIERNKDGSIAAIRRGEAKPGQEPLSLLDAEVMDFFKSSGELETLTQLLALSDMSMVRVLEDLVELLIEKKLILFTELPSQAQEKIRIRKKLRTEIAGDDLMVDDIL
jgi:hypothetical protein